MDEPRPDAIPGITLVGTNLQTQSPFFRLPRELRTPVYEAIRGTVQHVVRDAQGEYRFPLCITDHKGPDARQIPPPGFTPPISTFEDPVWSRRLASSWGNHWQCEEASRQGDAFPLALLALLLTCKRM